MDTLNLKGVKGFIEYAREEAYVLQENYYRPKFNRILNSNKTLSFQEFISCIYQYTDIWKNSVSLNVEVVENEEGTLHKLVIRGIRDPGIRENRRPQCFPGRQEGVWDCVLEEVMTNGLAAEEIDIFRQALNLLPKYGIFDKDFFHKRGELTL